MKSKKLFYLLLIVFSIILVADIVFKLFTAIERKGLLYLYLIFVFISVLIGRKKINEKIKKFMNYIR